MRRWPDKTRYWDAWYIPGSMIYPAEGREAELVALEASHVGLETSRFALKTAYPASETIYLVGEGLEVFLGGHLFADGLVLHLVDSQRVHDVGG